jgi:16S rRNA (cytidine1402-2'-O)-methyltransferase
MDKGRLSIVSTPIGNLDDITVRALSTLRSAHTVLAEDTRRTRKLLTHHAIGAKLRALHAHSTERELERCVADLADGHHLALVTDAGTPLISDPGSALVAAATASGIEIETIPGPSAVIAALSVCGIPFDGFRFTGFAPRTGGKRRAWLEAIAADPGASVFFEAPTRLPATLAELAACLHEERRVAVCRELTKMHEEVVRGTAGELEQRFAAGTRGEITVVVASGPARGPRPGDEDGDQLEPRILSLLGQGVSPRDVARQLSQELGLSRRKLYAQVQTLADENARGRFSTF